MSKFESDLLSEGLLPRFWRRYVDDTFAVIKKGEALTLLNVLNNRFPSIKFTVEELSTSNNLPFLDVLVQQVGEKLEFSVYRKPTTTSRYITKDSHCSYQNKIAAFQSMTYRLCKLPLSVANFKKEYHQIVQIAETNGFDRSLVDKLIYKHSNKIKKHESSTLFEQNHNIAADQQKEQRVSICYAPNITNKLQTTFKQSNIKLAYTNNYKLGSRLGCTKDTVPTRQRSGIYEISCSDCDAKYIGQTRRALHTRISEHLRSIKNRELHKAIPAHVFDPDNEHLHRITSFDENVKLIKPVTNSRKLDAYESIFISTNDNLMNLEKGAIESPLFKLLKK